MTATEASEPSRTHLSARDLPAQMADRLIVALDVPTVAQAERLVGELEGSVSFYKVGMWLLLAPGFGKFIDKLVSAKKNVFLDYKMYDIAETVKEGVKRALDRGVTFVTVHGDEEIVSASVSAKGDDPKLNIFAVTVLTSLDNRALEKMGYLVPVQELIDIRVRNALRCGCDGVIASADDNPDRIRERAQAGRLLIATPGIRLGQAGTDDHKRHTTPSQAIARGADYLVVGRPIVSPRTGTPLQAARAVIDDMKSGDRERRSRQPEH